MFLKHAARQMDICDARLLKSIYDDVALLGREDYPWQDVAATDCFKVGKGLIAIEKTTNLRFSFCAANPQMAHSLGMFTVDPVTGALGPVSMVWEDTSAFALTENTCLPAEGGELVGFVMIVDGFEYNDFADLDHGFFALAQTADGQLGLVHEDGMGNQIQIQGDVMISTQAQCATGYGISHSTCVEVGFEDGWAMSKGQFNALVFQVDVGLETAAAIAVNQRVAAEKETTEVPRVEVFPGGHLVDGTWVKIDTPRREDRGGTAGQSRPAISVVDGNMAPQPAQAPRMGSMSRKQDPIEYDVKAQSKIEDEIDFFIYTHARSARSTKNRLPRPNQIDLSETGLSFQQLKDRSVDLGWGTEIEFRDESEKTDIQRIIIRTPAGYDLCEDHFIL